MESITNQRTSVSLLAFPSFDISENAVPGHLKGVEV
jgi:hypothetical protein